MDHVPKPAYPTLNFPRVPFICEGLSEDVNFMDFPAAAGWGKLVPINGMTVTFMEDIVDPEEITRLESLLQGWAFFGLLRETLRPFGLFSFHDYTAVDDRGKYVHTTGLNARLAEVRAVVGTWSLRQKTELGDRLQECMRFAKGVLSGLVNVKTHTRIHHGIWMSALSVCETVSGASDMYLERSPESISHSDFWTQFHDLPLSDSFDLSKLTELGWCPSEVASCRRTLDSLHAQMFILGLSRPDHGLDHSTCSPDLCHRMQIDLSSYRPRHVHEQCTCETISADETEVAACLNDGTFPLLRIDGEDPDNASVEVVPFREYEPYVALSHVWADGLGNPVHTALPSCQIVALGRLVRDLRGCTFTWGIEGSETYGPREEKRDLLFWCDTLCCPTVSSDSPAKEEIELKATAISRLRRVYEAAEYVLVVDQSLRCVDTRDLGLLEQMIRVFLSRWIKRLWTFQEAALAGKLLFAFSDKLVDFRELWQYTTDLYRSSPAHSIMCRSLAFQCITLRSWREEITDIAATLNRLVHAVGDRRASVPSDEAICVATILGLDVKRVGMAGENDRMEVMWKLLSESSGGVPDDIIFTSFPRLSAPGYKWAPSTFQRPYSSQKAIITSGRHISKLVLTPQGALTHRAGWQIEVDWPLVGAGEVEQAWAKEYSDHVILRHPSGRWYVAQGIDLPNTDKIESFMGMLQSHRSRSWFIVLEDESATQGGQRGLLVVSEDSPEGFIYRSICLLQIARLIPHIEAFHELGHEHAEMIKARFPKTGYASTVTVERMGRMLGAWLPTGHEKYPHPVIKETTAALHKRNATEMRGLFEEYGQMAAKTPRAQQAISEARQWANSDILVAHVLRDYFNAHAKITKSFDRSRIWCID